jgi:hypothetical protein
VKPLHSTVTRKAGQDWTSQLRDLRETHTHSCWSRVPVVTHYIRSQAKSLLSALSPPCRILKLSIASRSWMKWSGIASPVSGRGGNHIHDIVYFDARWAFECLEDEAILTKASHGRRGSRSPGRDRMHAVAECLLFGMHTLIQPSTTL